MTFRFNARTSADDAIKGRLDVIEGDDQTVGSIAKALKDASGYTNSVSSNIRAEMNGQYETLVDKIDNASVNVTELFTEKKNVGGYTLSNLAKKNLYHDNGNTVKFVGYENSAIFMKIINRCTCFHKQVN